MSNYPPGTNDDDPHFTDETPLPPCNCGRPVDEDGCVGCALHPLDCSCYPVEYYDGGGQLG